MHTCACFMNISGCFHRICCLTSPHTSIHKGSGASRRRPFVDSFMDGCVWAGEAADAMETSINIHETCACMHITRDSCGYLANTYETIHWLNVFIHLDMLLLYRCIHSYTPKCLYIPSHTFIYIYQNMQY